MLRVLIVEDVEAKRDQLIGALEQQYSVDHRWARSVAAAYGLVNVSDRFDLVLLDMAFAAATEKAVRDVSAQAVAGLELLQFIKARRISLPVIVATSYDSFSDGSNINFTSISELDQFLFQNYKENYIGIINVRHTDEEWKSELFRLVEKVIK